MLKDFKDVKEAIENAKHAASTQRVSLANITGTCECYYEGIQYLNQQDQPFNITASAGRVPSISPDISKLRMVQNEVLRAIVKVQSFTYPSAMETDIQPPPMDAGVLSALSSDTLEKAADTLVENTGYLSCAVEANNRRAITGIYGLGWNLMVRGRIVGMDGQEVPTEDRVLRAFTWHPLRILLDPANQSSDLRMHPRVIYQDVWDIYKLRATFPSIDWDKKDLATVGQLTPYEQEVSRLSGYRLFGRYSRFSQTKGARVYQVHEKDDSNWRYGIMWVVVELPAAGGDDMMPMNGDNPTSPFGWDGLPLAELHGHPRADSRWSISDVGAVRDWQDQLNLFATWNMRAAQKFAYLQYMVDKRWFGQRTASDEAIRQQITNRPGGIVVGSPSSNDRSIQPPQLMQFPAPPPYFSEMMAAAKDGVTRNSFRSEVDFGNDLKSHTSDKLVQTYRRNSDEVLAIRVNQDRKAHACMLKVGLGTLVAGVQAGAPTPLADLRRAGFQEDDLALLLNIDPSHPCESLEVSESSIRHRTSEDKKRDILQAATSPVPLIDPMDARRELADLDSSLTAQDKQLQREIRKRVASLLQGIPWVPMQLENYNAWAVQELVRAQFEKPAKRDPQVLQMVMQAIEIQRQIGLQNQAQQVAAQQPPPPPEQGQEGEESGEPPSNVGEFLDQLEAG